MKLLLLFALLAPGLTVGRAQQQAEPAAHRTGGPKLFDEYGRIQAEDEMARLDNISVALDSEKDAVVYFYYYAGRLACAGEVRARAERAVNYLVKERRVEPDRIIWKHAGHRQEFTTEVWAQPHSAAAPRPSPAVDESQVRVRRRCKFRY